MPRTLTEAMKKMIAGKQYFKCANKPKSNLRGLKKFNCPLWKINDSDIKGNFNGKLTIQVLKVILMNQVMI